MAMNIQVYKTFDGPLEVERHIINNGETWLAGGLLNLDGDGHLNECASDATRATHLAITDQSDPGNDTTYTDVYRLKFGNTQYLVKAGDAQTIADTNKDTAYGLTVTSGDMRLDTGDTTVLAFNVLFNLAEKEPEQYSTADTPGVAVVTLNDALKS